MWPILRDAARSLPRGIRGARLLRMRLGFGLMALPRSIRARQIEDVFRDEVQDHVGRDRRHHIEPRLTELALDVVLLGEAEATMGLHAHVGGGPRRLRA